MTKVQQFCKNEDIAFQIKQSHETLCACFKDDDCKNYEKYAITMRTFYECIKTDEIVPQANIQDINRASVGSSAINNIKWLKRNQYIDLLIHDDINGDIYYVTENLQKKMESVLVQNNSNDNETRPCTKEEISFLYEQSAQDMSFCFVGEDFNNFQDHAATMHLILEGALDNENVKAWTYDVMQKRPVSSTATSIAFLVDKEYITKKSELDYHFLSPTTKFKNKMMHVLTSAEITVPRPVQKPFKEPHFHSGPKS